MDFNFLLKEVLKEGFLHTHPDTQRKYLPTDMCENHVIVDKKDYELIIHLIEMLSKSTVTSTIEGNTFRGYALPTKEEVVNHPNYYSAYPVEVIDMMIKIWGPGKVSEFCTLNAFKYRMRAGKKGPIETDLNKERWYMQKSKELLEVQLKLPLEK